MKQTDPPAAKLTFAGDIMVEHYQLPAYQTGEDEYDFTDMFSDMAGYFAESDFVCANLETPLAGKDLRYSYEIWHFNTPAQIAPALKQSGIDMVTTANNHCLDRGIKGLENTIDALDKHGLKHIGTHKDNHKPCFIEEINGIKVAFLSYTYGTNAFGNRHYLKARRRYMVNLFQNQELSNWILRKFWHNRKKPYAKAFWKMYSLLFPAQAKLPVHERASPSLRCRRALIRDIRECRAKGAEYVIMCMHAGGQLNSSPNKYVKNLSRFLLRNGVDAIVGHHEHVIHHCDMSRLGDNKIVTYSLGNFLGAAGVLEKPYDKMAEYSILLNIYLGRSAGSGTVKVERCTFSVAKSVKCGENRLKTALLYDLIQNCANADAKRKLIEDNTKAVNMFLGASSQRHEVKKEYEAASCGGA